MNPTEPAKFTVQWCEDEPTIALGDMPLDVDDVIDKMAQT